MTIPLPRGSGIVMKCFPVKIQAQVDVYDHTFVCTTWKVDGATPMYWFIMAPLLIHLLGVAPSTFTTVYSSWFTRLLNQQYHLSPWVFTSRS